MTAPTARNVIGCVVLAAGGSRRLGRPKQLLEYGGVPLVRHVLNVLGQSGLTQLAVVLGSEAERIAPALAGSPAERLDNLDWPEGVAASIRTAAAWAERRALTALVLVACDQPLLTAAHVVALCDAFEARPSPVASGYAGTLGIPALFPAGWYPQLQRLRGDHGAGRALRADPTVQVIDWPDGALDIDTEADAAAL